MAKKFLALILLIAAAVPFFSASAQKFGVVKPDDVMRDLPELRTAQNELEAVSRKYAREDSVLRVELQAKYDDFQKIQADAATPDAIKERRMQEIQDMSNKYQQFQQNAQQDMQRQQEILLAPLQQKMIEAIQAVGNEGSYTMIFTTDMPAYVGKDVIDVTPEVRKRLGLK